MSEAQSRALDLSRAGRHDEAAEVMRAAVETRQRDHGRASRDEYLLWGLFLHNAGRIEAGVRVLNRAAALFPQDAQVHENLGVMLGRLNRHEQAVTALERALAAGSDSVNVHDALCRTYALLGRMDAAVRHGIASLEGKDAAARAGGVAYPLPAAPPRSFDPATPKQNVVAFSLWGDKPRYTDGAIRNALLMPEIYPGWTARIYVDDTVPRSVLDRLRALGAELVPRPRPAAFYEGLLWRFEVLGDPNVRRFLIRDADAIVNTQERAAVDAWLASGRLFHVMRDWPSHTDLILAGLWGGVGGMLPPPKRLLADFKPFRLPTATYDQDILRMTVWPTARQSCLIHDSYFDCLGSVPFPPHGRLPPGMHVGQNHQARRVRPPGPTDRRR